MSRLLIRALAVLGVLVLALVGAGIWLWSNAAQSNLGELSFANELRMPPLAEPSVDGPGRKVFDLRLEEGDAELLPGKQTETWGANGPYLGPTLRAERGDEVTVNVDNELPGTTTLHWHGMHLPAAADGGPHQMIEPGQTWSPSWTIEQPAASLWYHPASDGRDRGPPLSRHRRDVHPRWPCLGVAVAAGRVRRRRHS